VSKSVDPHRNLGLVPGLAQLRDRTDGGSPHVTVAVIDGPVDASHSVFEGANLQLLGPSGRAALSGDPLAVHGTFVTSVLVGQPGTLVEGICPKIRLLHIPVYDPSTGRAAQLELALAIELAISEGADIINLSGGQYSDTGVADQFLTRAVDRCESQGVLLVAAAGNDGCECLHVPAAAATVLAVGALNDEGEALDFSNWGELYRTNGIMAPGMDILGAAPNGQIEHLSGTSCAAPIVAGAAALLLSLARRSDPRARAHSIGRYILAGALPCRPMIVQSCERMLAGSLNIEGALRAMSTDSAEPQQFESRSAGPSCGCAGSDSSGGMASSPLGGITPSMADAPDDGNLVYALGSISYDFGTEARRDSFKQLMPPVEIDGVVVPPNPYDARQLVSYLGSNPSEARAVIWTLNIELTPIYALEPAGAFGADIYNRVVQLLAGEILAESDTDHVERVSIPGRLTGRTVKLFSGQIVPVLQIDNSRGLYGWRHNFLVEQAAEAVSSRADASADSSTIANNLRGFLDRVYYDLRNLGVLSADRAVNFAATNAFQAAAVFSSALGSGMQLESIESEASPYARRDADAWDVKLKFFDPENTRRARTVYRFTVDVSEIMPVTLGEIRSWSTAG